MDIKQLEAIYSSVFADLKITAEAEIPSISILKVETETSRLHLEFQGNLLWLEGAISTADYPAGRSALVASILPNMLTEKFRFVPLTAEYLPEKRQILLKGSFPGMISDLQNPKPAELDQLKALSLSAYFFLSCVQKGVDLIEAIGQLDHYLDFLDQLEKEFEKSGLKTVSQISQTAVQYHIRIEDIPVQEAVFDPAGTKSAGISKSTYRLSLSITYHLPKDRKSFLALSLYLGKADWAYGQNKEILPQLDLILKSRFGWEDGVNKTIHETAETIIAEYQYDYQFLSAPSIAAGINNISQLKQLLNLIFLEIQKKGDVIAELENNLKYLTLEKFSAPPDEKIESPRLFEDIGQEPGQNIRAAADGLQLKSTSNEGKQEGEGLQGIRSAETTTDIIRQGGFYSVVLVNAGRFNSRLKQVLSILLSVNIIEAAKIIEHTPYTLFDKVSAHKAKEIEILLKNTGARIELKQIE